MPGSGPLIDWRRVCSRRPVLKKALFRKIDNHMLRVADLDAAIAFYQDKLGHRLLWRDQEAAGLAMAETDAELVLHRKIGPETDLLVDDADRAFDRFLSAGGESVQPPFDIPIGRCARVRDPFGNIIVMLDQSKGTLAMDELKRVTGVKRRK
jgi:predicted enzyme related to lactoylglutathione lyase